MSIAFEAAAVEFGSPAENPIREKMIKKIFRQIGMIKPYQAREKEETDYFLVGTAVLNKSSQHADVCFQIKKGQKEAAEYITDFSMRPAGDSLWKWQVFFRLKDQESAEKALQFVRNQYDQQVAYRQQLMKAYKAKTIRRC